MLNRNGEKLYFISQDQVLFSEIKSQVAVHTNGQEGGKLSLGVATHDGEMQYGLILADGSAEDEIDVTIGNGSSSVTTIAGDLTVNGTTTTVSSTTLSVTDDLITCSKGNDTIANAWVVLDDDERFPMYYDAQRSLDDDVPSIVITQPHNMIALRSDLGGYAKYFDEMPRYHEMYRK